MKSIDCSKIIGKKKIENLCEFNLVMAIANVSSCFDSCLDMTMMNIDQNTVPTNSLEKFRYYIQEGKIFMGKGVKPSKKIEQPESDVDVSYFNDVKLYGYEDNMAVWSFVWAEKNYGENAYKFTIYKKRGYLVLAVIAYYLIKRYFEEEKAEHFNLSFNSIETVNIYYYMDVYGCKKSLDWFDDCIELSLDFREARNVDLDYSLFCRSSFSSGRYGSYTMPDKLSLVKKYNWKIGDILVVWKRNGMCSNNKFGNLKSSTLIRLDEVGKDYLGVTEMFVNKTKEEVQLEYNEMDEESKFLFSDILNKPPLVRSRVIRLTSVGIGEYFGGEEDLIITELDKKERVVKTITINDTVTTIEMKGIDAIYWLLSQYNIEFNKFLFKERYSPDKDLLWDLYNPS